MKRERKLNSLVCSTGELSLMEIISLSLLLVAITIYDQILEKQE